MHCDKENQEICVMGRLFSLEALIFLMGLVSLFYGIFARNEMNIVIGALILMVAAVVARILSRRYHRHRHGTGAQGRR